MDKSSSLTIVGLRTIPVRIPFRDPLVESSGAFTHADSVLLLLETDAGITGVSEIQSYANYERPEVMPPAGIVELIDSAFAPLVLGHDALELNTLWSMWDRAITGKLWIKSAIDIAIHDAVAKAYGVPAHVLLGGPRKAELVVEAVGLGISIGNPEDVADIAADAVRSGFMSIEIKVGRAQQPLLDIESVHRVRAAIGPTIPLKVDANGRYPRSVAARVMREVAIDDLEVFEQPVNPRDLDGLLELRRAGWAPISVDESVASLEDLVEVVKRGAADAVHVKPTIKGGFTGGQALAQLARASGMDVLVGPNICTGVGMAAVHSFAASVPDRLGGVHGSPLDFLHDDVVANPISRSSTTVSLSESPGLGVDLDLAKVAQWRRAQKPEALESSSESTP